MVPLQRSRLDEDVARLSCFERFAQRSSKISNRFRESVLSLQSVQPCIGMADQHCRVCLLTNISGYLCRMQRRLLSTLANKVALLPKLDNLADWLVTWIGCHAQARDGP